ncbi:glycoside hydrolase family 108 protein [Burkholderia sp. Bp8963]|uniref:glycoside hydrolase family 108 protein n=1 Tax=Burkholderia sp. Bp8963 TaxID=2184547 RepID=UPI0021AB4596|nr:glycosyl hydrolase 108 family protein [Burkholderia sp. Bp8963]
MSFGVAFSRLIGNEGGYSFNPNDPGGETMWGVTARVARADGYSGPMQLLPKERAYRIAKSKYWDPLKLDEVDAYSSQVAFQILDANFNGGLVVLWIQKSCNGPIEIDGKYGDQTLKAIINTDPHVFILRFLAYRLKYLKDLHAWPTFGRGWVDRVANNLLLGAA